MRNRRGFTLIELLVVLVIIGITLTFALLSFGDFGAKRRVITEAEQFLTQIKLVQHQAMLESTPFSVQIDTQSYHVLRFKPPHQWVAVNAKHPLYQHTFPAHVVVRSGNQFSATKLTILIEASGDMSPFELSFGMLHEPEIIRVIGLANGTLTLTKPSTP